jgi:hypothetical protein
VHHDHHDERAATPVAPTVPTAPQQVIVERVPSRRSRDRSRPRSRSPSRRSYTPRSHRTRLAREVGPESEVVLQAIAVSTLMSLFVEFLISDQIARPPYRSLLPMQLGQHFHLKQLFYLLLLLFTNSSIRNRRCPSTCTKIPISFLTFQKIVKA